MVAKKAIGSSIPSEKVELYDKLIESHSDIKRKGATLPYTSLNGNMFTLLSKTGTLAIRLSSADREAFMKKFKTTPFENYGVIMKEYVAVPEELFENTKEMKKYLDMSYDYAKTLKPKPTTRRKK
ncbi:MAG: hypothetical protein OK457_08875 [Thaumarchaeota archaeon]|nr:hypothetical protein [Nitrososphaerota archaeon]